MDSVALQQMVERKREEARQRRAASDAMRQQQASTTTAPPVPVYTPRPWPSGTSIAVGTYQQQQQQMHQQQPPVAFKLQQPASFLAQSPVRKVVCLELTDPLHFSAYCKKQDSEIEDQVFRTTSCSSHDQLTRTWTYRSELYSTVVKKLLALANSNTRSKIVINLIPDTVLDLFGIDHSSLPRSTAMPKKRGSKAAPPQRIQPDQLVCSPPDLKYTNVNAMSQRLFPFQKEGVKRGLERKGRILIADDMGLGKTVQAITIASFYCHEWPLLVICPSSLKLTLQEQFVDWCAPDIVSAKAIQVIGSTKEKVTGRIVIISYDLAVRKCEELLALKFKVVVADESHAFRNQKSKRTQNLLPIMQNATRCILLSGTPALSRPVELFSQIQAINPLLYPDLHEYALRYCAAHQSHWGWDYKGNSNLTELNLVLEHAILIRRLKSQVLTQLPPKQRKHVFLAVEAKDAHRLNSLSAKLSDSTLQSLTGGGGKGGASSSSVVATDNGDEAKPQSSRSLIMDLWTETAVAKMPAMKEYVRDLLDNDSKLKFLLFAHHTSVLDGFSDLLDELKVGYIRIDGKTPSAIRQDLCFQFQTDEECQVALLGINAAGVGLTLTAASLVVFAELYWNPGVLLQAEDRVHRIGQQNSVNVHYLIARDTLDDRLWGLIKEKMVTLERVGLNRTDELQVDTEEDKDPVPIDRRQTTLDSFKPTKKSNYSDDDDDDDDDITDQEELPVWSSGDFKDAMPTPPGSAIKRPSSNAAFASVSSSSASKKPKLRDDPWSAIELDDIADPDDDLLSGKTTRRVFLS